MLGLLELLPDLRGSEGKGGCESGAAELRGEGECVRLLVVIGKDEVDVTTGFFLEDGLHFFRSMRSFFDEVADDDITNRKSRCGEVHATI